MTTERGPDIHDPFFAQSDFQTIDLLLFESLHGS